MWLLPWTVGATGFVWTGGNGQDWDDSGNWDLLSGFPGSGDTAAFDASASGFSVNLNGGQFADTLDFSGSGAYAVGGGSLNLTIGDIGVASAAVTHSFTGDIDIAGDGFSTFCTWSIGAGATFDLSGQLSTQSLVIKQGDGTLRLSNPGNSFPLGMNFEGGTLSVSGPGATPLFLNMGDNTTLDVTAAHTNSTGFSIGSTTIHNDVDFTVSGPVADYFAAPTGGNLIKTGSGKLTLSNASNSYTMGTNVFGGVLSIGADGALGSSFAPVFMENGTTLEVTAPQSTNRTYYVGNTTFHSDFDFTLNSGLAENFAAVGPFVLTKTGSGSLVLNAAGSFSGLISMQQNTLVLGGAGPFPASIDLSDATLEVDFAQSGNGPVSIYGVCSIQTDADFQLNSQIFSFAPFPVLKKIGPASLTLAEAGNYSGETQVLAGTLLANNLFGSATGASDVTVFDGATLGGTGAVGGGLVTVNPGAKIAPGASVGALTVSGALAMSSGSELEMEIDGTPANQHDVLQVNGSVQLGGALLLDLGYAPTIGDSFVIIENDGADPVVGTFSDGAAVSATFGGGTHFFLIDYSAGDGNDVGLAAVSGFDHAVALTGLTGPDAGPDAIPFGDGVPNLLKYAFGMDLSGSDAHRLIPGSGFSGLPAIDVEISVGGGIFRVEFVRRVGGELDYAARKSPDLSSPVWTDLTDTPTVTPIGSDYERVVYEEPFDLLSDPRGFVRVEVSLN
ncbi:hypothetical protein HAHE_19600 [Haloferula helveola]|uniref:Autotransporter-associated beta strand repeat-containing protein n=2 Tax=Haloferula helveola TaxID=490095 RepID=A0ABM7R9S9_9BACT|nr:hypothetical protein HAHE_19600 [Haloferula helveola]